MMNWIAPIAVALGALLQIWLEGRSQAKKRKGKLAIWGSLFALLLATSLYHHHSDSERDERNAEVLATNKQLIAQNRTLDENNRVLLGQNVSLLSRVDSLSIEISQLRIDEGFQSIREDVGALRPRLKMVGAYRVEHEADTGAIRTLYYFRASPSGTLRDIKITLRFDGEFRSSGSRVSGSMGSGGAIVIESGTRLIEDSDRRGLTLSTNELMGSNDLEVSVVGSDTLHVVAYSCAP